MSHVSCPSLFQEYIGLILGSCLTEVLEQSDTPSVPMNIPGQIAVDCKSVNCNLD